MTPEQIDKAIEDHFLDSPEGQRQWLRLLLETGERLVSLTVELGSTAGLELWDRGAYNDYMDEQRERKRLKRRERMRLCAHKNTRSVNENDGAVLFRCLDCGMGRNWVGDWAVPAKKAEVAYG